MVFKHRKNTFVAWLLRLKFLSRWPLMKSIEPENVAAHSHEVSVIAHMIATIGRYEYDRDYNPSEIAVLAIYHESSEAAGVSDIPSPVKYMNPQITEAIKHIEHQTELSLVNTLPDSIKNVMTKYVVQSEADKVHKDIVKAADLISMRLKAQLEINFNNKEFTTCAESLDEQIEGFRQKYAEVDKFCLTYLSACEMTLDELIK